MPVPILANMEGWFWEEKEPRFTLPLLLLWCWELAGG